MLVGVLYMAFVMVIISTMLMIPFCLWALDLASNGWTGADVALFGATIASTDAASVAAILSAGVCVGRSAEHQGLGRKGLLDRQSGRHAAYVRQTQLFAHEGLASFVVVLPAASVSQGSR